MTTAIPSRKPIRDRIRVDCSLSSNAHSPFQAEAEAEVMPSGLDCNLFIFRQIATGLFIGRDYNMFGRPMSWVGPVFPFQPPLLASAIRARISSRPGPCSSLGGWRSRAGGEGPTSTSARHPIGFKVQLRAVRHRPCSASIRPPRHVRPCGAKRTLPGRGFPARPFGRGVSGRPPGRKARLRS